MDTSYDKEDIKRQIVETPDDYLIDVLNDLVADGVLEFVGEYYIN